MKYYELPSIEYMHWHYSLDHAQLIKKFEFRGSFTYNRYLYKSQSIQSYFMKWGKNTELDLNQSNKAYRIKPG